jgi:hypothetical protein
VGRRSPLALGVSQVIIMRYLGSRNILKISHTLRVVTDCWGSAEESLRTDIRADYPGVNEEFITLRSVICISSSESMGCKGLAAEFAKPRSNDFNSLG